MTYLSPRPLATHDFYGPIHKGLRFAMTQLLVRLGCADTRDGAGLAQLMADVRALLDLSAHHLENEDLHVHAALEARAPGASLRLMQAHDHHRLSFEEIEVLTRQVDRAHPDDRPQMLRRLYLRFSEFVADDLAHMAEEEQVILPVLQSLFTDAELQRIEDRIMSGLTPEDMIGFGRILIPAANREERIALLSAVRANAPAPAFEAILTLSAKPTLSDADWSHLAAGLGVAA
ncbi:hypothetical protein ACFODL_18855 [Phenylobacterium terrae]|uniref:Hemerythrin-like domain-containing protein n=1 Tax=Phenylobacterium terrae TaxID=2665495 RepID=A0ABW4MZP5_9CAUL